MKSDGAPAARGLGLDLAGVAVVDLQSALGDTDARRVGVDVDEAPAEPGKLAWSQAAHEAGEPHGGPWIGRDGVEEQALRLLDCEAPAGVRWPLLREQHLGGGVCLDPPVTQSVL